MQWKEKDITYTPNGITCVHYFNDFGIHYFSIYTDSLSVVLGTSSTFAAIGTIGRTLEVDIVKNVIVSKNINGFLKINTDGIVFIGFTTENGNAVNLTTGTAIYISETFIF